MIRARKFGVQLTNSLDAVGGGCASQKSRDFPANASATATASAQRYYHQYQYSPQHGIQQSFLFESAKPVKNPASKQQTSHDKENGDQERRNASSSDHLDLAQAIGEFSLEKPLLWASPDDPGKRTAQAARSIWSVTPEELSALALQATRRETVDSEPPEKLSYAVVSSRSLSAAGKDEAADVEGHGPVFTKYFALPVFPPSRTPERGVELLEQKSERPAFDPSEPSESEHLDVLDYRRVFALSAETPIFCPRQNFSEDTDTTEIIEMVREAQV
ncbi:hypothetical protein BBJ28_00006419 [Nothophytophthora sp. Chile5]|nr:hypothetical protein BBJ28_00006419 [Nothophytophthora sp. Chile5]